MHPNEIPLLFRAASGAVLPHRGFGEVVRAEVEARTMTDAKRLALGAQVDRQRTELTR